MNSKKEKYTGWMTKWMSKSVDKFASWASGEPQEALDGLKVMRRYFSDPKYKAIGLAFLTSEEGIAEINEAIIALAALENKGDRFALAHGRFVANVNPYLKDRYRIPPETEIQDMAHICAQMDSSDDEEEYRVPDPPYAENVIVNAFVSYLYRKTNLLKETTEES